FVHPSRDHSLNEPIASQPRSSTLDLFLNFDKAPCASGEPGVIVDAKKRCFVLMGFGVKVDYKTNRSLDLDKTYKIIRAAVETGGLSCIGADDIVHSGVIDTPMYENLLNADVAIADLSTSNENALYELGVRHALRPFTTIVIAESQFKF